MNEEYKNLLFQTFHKKDHEMYEPDYYSWKYEIIAEGVYTIGLRLDVNLLDKPFHDLITHLMEWGLMITGIAIASDQFDNEWLSVQLTEIARDEE